LKNKDIKVSQIASGIPIGGNIEFIDMATLVKSLEGRKSVK
jgi:recombination protein RecR